MAFWGVVVKPGKPFIHSCEKARGRLRISQATLGISDATKKSIVQCNVGKRSPVLLCSLLPNHTESCHLDLEFEESDDVVFSVIGPRSVYLTGYYVGQSQQSNPQSDTESYGEDIEHSETEEFSYHSDDDKYEDSFIDDDDDELQDFSSSPVLARKVIDETTSENDNPKIRKGRGKRLKRKCQVVESDEDARSHESEDEDGYLLSVFKSASKTTLTGVEGNINLNLPVSNGKEQINSLDHANPKRKRKECSKDEKTCEVQIDKYHNVFTDDKEHEVKASKNLDIMVSSLQSCAGKCSKTKKTRKEQLKGTSMEGTEVKFGNVAKDDKFDQDLFHADTMKNLTKPDGDQGQHIDNQPGKKTKKKKTKNKKNQEEGDSNMTLPNMTDNQGTTLMKFENQTSNAKPKQNRTLSNGLIVEELATGPPDGKVASRGKKVKVYYTAMLKENGHIFDSNLGKNSCKFRLGDDEIIDGWNFGIEGMHVGDQRRLIIPPSMGFGKHGKRENVPPNSWLVYDVELVGVYK